ncbi:hypothetical protein JW916_16040 [Candidatus Sumerlaeota bacterium]|nr:hypothetical protein [Candidatus Sumerlaeota bacterium]
MNLSEYHWTPGFNDPTWLGLTATCLYLLSAALCGACAAREIPPSENARANTSQRRFWLCLALLMFALGANKEVDFQTWIVSTARRVSIRQGWYPWRTVVKVAFATATVLAGGLLFVLSVRETRGIGAARPLLLAGIVTLCAFVLLRVVPFGGVWGVAAEEKAETPWLKGALEIGGIVLVLASNAAYLVHTRREP